MNLSITKNLKEKIIKLGYVLVFVFILSLILDFVMKFIPFRDEIKEEGYQNINSVSGFPETWASTDPAASGDELELMNADYVNGWVFDSSDGSDNEINAVVDTNNKEYKYISHTDDTSYLTGNSYIILRKDLSLVKDIKYTVSTMVNIGDDNLDDDLHYLNINGTNTLKVIPIKGTQDYDGFYRIEQEFIATSVNMNIELISEMTSKGDKTKEIRWKEVYLTYEICDTVKCEFKPCSNAVSPIGYTGNVDDGVIDLPQDTVQNSTYYYKNINHSCKDGAEDCYKESTCNSCLPGKMMIDKNSRSIVGYMEPGATVIKPYPDCEISDDPNLPSDFWGIYAGSYLDNNSNNSNNSNNNNNNVPRDSSFVGTTVDAVGNVATGGLRSVGGAASMLGGIIQALGGGIYAVYDYDTGKANVVSGSGTSVAGAENIINGLVEAGRIPTNAIFGAVGANLVSGDLEKKAQISETTQSNSIPKPNIPLPYEASLNL